MDFLEIANIRQSCRSYDAAREVEREKLDAILEAARLAPSACNAQPYHITVCTGDTAKAVAETTVGMGINKFTSEVPIMLVISDAPYNLTSALGAFVKKSDYRIVDVGIAAAYITAEAATQGLGTCIIGWFDEKKIRQIIDLDSPVRLVIALGYAKEGDPLRKKVRKDMSVLVSKK